MTIQTPRLLRDKYSK